MRSILALLMLAVVRGHVAWEELPGYSFEKFVSEFHLKIGSHEWSTREEIFKAELSRIVAHNSKSSSWKQNVNSMSAMSSSEKSSLLGYSKNTAKHPKVLGGASVGDNSGHVHVSELPESVDWRSEGIVSAVKDQGGCGSCWAFATTATIESHVAKETGKLFNLSPQQVTSCAWNPNECGGTGGCEGATAEIGFSYVAGSQGFLEEFQYSYGSYYGEDSECNINAKAAPKASINGYIKLLDNNYTQLMNAVAQEGPVAISVDASEWHSYDSGIFNGCNQVNPDINHAVVLVGYGVDGDQKYWTVRNSWSASWGENGYIRVLRQDDDDVNNCGMDITPEDGTACFGDDTPMKACGTCGILFDSAYPTGAILL